MSGQCSDRVTGCHHHGATVEVAHPGGEWQALVQAAMPIGSRVLESGEVDARLRLEEDASGCRLSDDEKVLVEGATRETVLGRLESALHTKVAENARGVLFIHAGVVAWRGRAIVVPGRSRTGKTSLVAALVRAGADYYSDEYAVIDRLGRVLPYPKTLSIRDQSGGSSRIPVEALGGTQGQGPVRVGALVFTRFRPDDPPRLESISAARAVIEILKNTVRARALPDVTIQLASRMSRNAMALRGKRGEADATALGLLQRIDDAGALWSLPTDEDPASHERSLLSLP